MTDEYDYVAIVVQNYDKEKLWKAEYRDCNDYYTGRY